MPKQEKEKLPRPKITIIPGRGVAQTINYLLEDRDDLEWIIAVGRTKNGELFFYDTGGDIVEKQLAVLGTANRDEPFEIVPVLKQIIDGLGNATARDDRDL